MGLDTGRHFSVLRFASSYEGDGLGTLRATSAGVSRRELQAQRGFATTGTTEQEDEAQR
jgi:hypothetical protein